MGKVKRKILGLNRTYLGKIIQLPIFKRVAPAIVTVRNVTKDIFEQNEKTPALGLLAVNATMLVCLLALPALRPTDAATITATGEVIPNADVTTGWATATGTDNSCPTATHNHCESVDEARTSPSTTDYVATGTGGSTGEVEEFDITSLTLPSSGKVTKIELFMYAQSATNANGSTLDDVDLNIRIAGSLQTAVRKTPAFNSWAWHSATFNAPSAGWSQSDLDAARSQFTRVRQGGGSPSGQDDDVRIATVYAVVTYQYPAPPAKITQEGYIFENDDEDQATGDAVDENTQQAAANTAITGVKKGERLTVRMQIKNTGDTNLNQNGNLGLFYDRNDGIFSRIKTNKPATTATGNCTDTAFDCVTVDNTGTNTGQHASVAIDPNGTPWISYYDSVNGELKVAQYVGSGGNCTSGAWNCMIVASGGSYGPSSSIAFNSDGTPWIAFFNEAADDVYVAQFVGSGASACGGSGSTAWSCELVDSGTHTTKLSLAFNTNGKPWVSYYDSTNSALKVATRGGGFGSTCTDADWTCGAVDQDTDDTGKHSSIAFDADGDPWISYFDDTTDQLMVGQYVGGTSGTGCGASGSTAWICETVDNTGTITGEYTSLAFAPDGTPWVSFYDQTNTALRVAARSTVLSTTCTDTDWTCIEVDTTNSVGKYTSLAFDPAGGAWVSYLNDDSTADNKALKYARYVGSSGSGCASTAWSCSTVDASGSDVIGEYSSIAFNTDGTAWIAYYDGGTETALKVANLKRGGEITISPGLAGKSTDAISESHADMTSTTDTTNRDDADCRSGSTTWNAGKWFEAEEGSGVNLPAGDSTAQCTEVAFTIDTSQAVAGRTYRIVIATKDNFRVDKGPWRGPIAVASGAYATLTIESDTTTKHSKDNQPKLANCDTDTNWGCALVESTNTVGNYSSVAIDASGNPWVSYWDAGTNNNLRVARYVGSGGSGCGGGSSAWTCTLVDSANDVGEYTSIAFAPDGNPWVSYYDTTSDDLRVAQYVGSGGTGCADSAWTCITVEATDDVGRYNSIAFDPAGNPWVSYYDGTGTNLRVARYVGSGGSGCGGGSSAWTCTLVEATNTVGWFTSIAFDSSGNPWISYYDFTNGDLRVAQYVGSGGSGCGGGSTAWTCTAVDSTDTVGEYTSLTFDASGAAWISYRDGGTASLNVAKYVGSSGTGCASAAWTCTVVDDPANSVGQYTSIASDPSGNPWVSYYDATAGNLHSARYVGSGGTGCTSTAWTCTLVEATNDIARTTSIAFDSSGNPWVGFYDFTNGDLRVAKLHMPLLKPIDSSGIAYPGRSAGRSYGKYRLDTGKSPRTESGTCSSTTDNKGYCGVAADDSDFDQTPVQANERPLYVFNSRFSANSTAPTITWKGRTNVAPSSSGTTGDLKLQIYRFGTTNAWEDVTSDTASSDCNTADCTLTGTPSGTASEYFEADGSNYWSYFRVWQYENTSTETLKTDAFTATAGGANTAPGNPSSLAQKKTDDTVLATGDWTNETSIKLTATVTDSDGGDTIKICAEVDPIGTAFSSPAADGDGCSTTGVSSGGTATVTISGLSIDTEYHWQIKAKDAAGAYSSWVTYGGNTENPPTNPAARDFGIDTSAPTGGAVYDGTTTDVDEDFNSGSLSQLSANWSGFNTNVSGLSKYQYSIGTTVGGTDVKAWTDNGTTTSVTATGLTLDTSKMYYFNVRAVDNAGNTQSPVITSDGQMILPDLSFTLSSTNVNFVELNSGNSWTDTKTTGLTTSSNAFGGYAVRAYNTSLLTAPAGFGSPTISAFSGGTYASPAAWGSNTGFGFTTDDADIFPQSGACSGGGTAPCYAPFTLTGPGDIVASRSTSITAGETVTITYKVAVDTTQKAAPYQTTVVYTNTPLY